MTNKLYNTHYLDYLKTVAVGNPGTANLVSWWSFNEASGTLADSHGSNDGTLGGTVSYGATGKVSDCLDFGDGEVDCGADSSFDVSALTFCAWIKLDANANYQVICSKRENGAGKDMWGWDVRGSGKLVFWINDNGGAGGDWNQWETTGTPISTGTWYHVAVTYDAVADAVFYVDGSSEASSRTLGDIVSIVTNTSNFVIGNLDTNTTSQSLDGLIDEPSLFSAALTANEISWLYNGGSGRAYSDL